MSSNWAGGSTAAWKQIRAVVLARDEYKCRLQLPRICTGNATHVHHTQNRAVVGDDPAHLIASCEACNTSYGNPDQPKYGDPQPNIKRWWK